jgi:hypothetical protein
MSSDISLRSLFLGLLGLPLVAQERCFPDPDGFLHCTDPGRPPVIKSDPAALVKKMEVEFAEVWNGWVKLRDETPPGTISLKARKQWLEKVEPAWKEIRLAVRNEV